MSVLRYVIKERGLEEYPGTELLVQVLDRVFELGCTNWDTASVCEYHRFFLLADTGLNIAFRL